LAIKQQMQEKKFAYKERIMQYKLELVRLKQGQVPITSGVHAVGLAQGGLVQEGLSTNAYPSNMDFSRDTFTFGTNATTTLPSLSSATWGSPEVSASQSII